MSVPTPAELSPREQVRLVTLAQGLFLERGIGPVGLADLALAARQPVTVVEGYFPAGKPALVTSVVERYLADLHQQLAQHGLQSSNAVEELLRVRQVLQDLPNEMRSLFLHELETDYSAHYQRLRTGRMASVSDFMRQNLARGLAEELYQAPFDVDQEARQWFAPADATVQAGASPQEISELLTAQLNALLARVCTPAGAYVARRLQEAAPYY